jgi:hypothetical protein
MVMDVTKVYTMTAVIRVAAGTAKATGCTPAAAAADLEVILTRSVAIATASGTTGSGTLRPTRAACRALLNAARR